jgi:hypothetical protein
MNESKLNEVGKMSLIMPSATGKSASFLFTFGFKGFDKYAQLSFDIGRVERTSNCSGFVTFSTGQEKAIDFRLNCM